jgi:hypothetical protein
MMDSEAGQRNLRLYTAEMWLDQWLGWYHCQAQVDTAY